MSFILPPVLTPKQFARCCQINEAVVRRKIRSKEIPAYGSPYRIPCRELIRFGVNLEDAAIFLASTKENSPS